MFSLARFSKLGLCIIRELQPVMMRALISNCPVGSRVCLEREGKEKGRQLKLKIVMSGQRELVQCQRLTARLSLLAYLQRQKTLYLRFAPTNKYNCYQKEPAHKYSNNTA